MLLVFAICTLLLLLYVAGKAAFVAKTQVAVAAFLESELKAIKAAQELPKPTSLAYGWFDDGWPNARVDEEERAPLENPHPNRSSDDYAAQWYISEFKALSSAHQRKKFLRRLLKEGITMKPELLDIIYADESAYVRAWAAGHLDTKVKDFTNWTSMNDVALEIRNYEPALLDDHEPVVRAAFWSNPGLGKRLPWYPMIRVSDEWKEQIKSMSQLERLGLMRNPDLSMHYVVALLETSSEELNLSRAEHAEILRAAAINPRLIGSSRRTGRDAWAVEHDYNPPFKEYGMMWELCLNKWMDEPLVPYLFTKYIQTTPEVKLATYQQLLQNADSKWLRREVIRSCDPFIDKLVLKAAWDDPDEDCRRIAKERVGRLAKYVGVKERANP
jgi:hypothetical protein